MRGKTSQLLAISRVPETHRLVVTCGKDLIALGREDRLTDGPLVGALPEQGGGPDAREFIRAGGDHALGVGEGDALHRAVVSEELHKPAVKLIEPRDLIVAGDGEPCAIR